MQIRSLLCSLLMLTMPGGASALPGADEFAALARKTGVLGVQAADAALDDAAAYWFARDRNGTRSLAGSGPALAAAIRIARADALRSGAKPVPPEIKRAFRRHYSSKVLDEARWIVAAPNSRLGRLLARWPVQNGAVTLNEVIVFKTRAAAANRRLFAHELTHVEQYRRLGIDRFANRYAAKRAAMEQEAHAKARRVMQSA
jgi:Tfp pilus assembly protein FimT